MGTRERREGVVDEGRLVRGGLDNDWLEGRNGGRGVWIRRRDWRMVEES